MAAVFIIVIVKTLLSLYNNKKEFSQLCREDKDLPVTLKANAPFSAKL